MNVLSVQDFSLFHTLDSGHLFTYYPQKDHYVLLVNDAVIKVKQEGDKLFYVGKKYDGTVVEEKDIISLFALDNGIGFLCINGFPLDSGMMI